jgi:hypothetical protein
MLFTVFSTCGFQRNPYSTLVLKLQTKKRETRKLEAIHELHFVEHNNECRKPDCAAKALFSCPAIISQRLEPRITSNEPLENTEEESKII